MRNSECLQSNGCRCYLNTASILLSDRLCLGPTLIRKPILPCFALLCSSHHSEDVSLVSTANNLDMTGFNPYGSLPISMSRGTDSISEVACDSPPVPHRASFAFVRLYSHRWGHLAEGKSVLCCRLIEYREQYANVASNPSTVRRRRLKIARQAERIPIAPRH